MEWFNYLRRDRARQIDMIAVMLRNDIRVSRMVDGTSTDMTLEAVAQHNANITEIEQILRDAGEPLE